MSVKVAINGFGRIGRLAFRQMFGAEGYEIVAINDLTSPDMLAHLLKYDSAQKRYEKADTVFAGEDSITVDGKTIKIYAEKEAQNLPWGEIGVDVVLECTGFYTSKEKAWAHIEAGAKKVVISAPAGKDLPTVVFGVNENVLTAEDKVISAASCTTNCLAPMAKALNDYAPIQSGIMTTVHAYTGDQMLLDGPHRKGDLRRAKSSCCKYSSKLNRSSKSNWISYTRIKWKTNWFSSKSSSSNRFNNNINSCCKRRKCNSRKHKCCNEISKQCIIWLHRRTISIFRYNWNYLWIII